MLPLIDFHVKGNGNDNFGLEKNKELIDLLDKIRFDSPPIIHGQTEEHLRELYPANHEKFKQIDLKGKYPWETIINIKDNHKTIEYEKMRKFVKIKVFHGILDGLVAVQ